MFGIGRYVPHYVDALAQAGWNVDVQAPFPFYPSWRMDRSVPKHSEEGGGRIKITRYAPFVPRKHSAVTRALHELSLGLAAQRTLLAEGRKPDLYVAASPPLLGAASVGWFARRRRTPCLILAYDLVSDLAGDAFGLAGRIPATVTRRLEARLYARADGVIALSDDMASRIYQLSGRRSETSVIRIWADDELFELDHRVAARSFRARLEIPDERYLVGFAGNFGRKQQLPLVVDAVRQLPRDFTTVFIGDGLERPEMERLARAGPGDVRLLPPQPATELHAFLSACDVSLVVAWTQHAGSLFPSKVANVLAAGSPIVAVTARGTDLATLLEREGLGLACTNLDDEVIRRAIRRGVDLGRDQARRAACRAYAHRYLYRAHAMTQFVTEAQRLAR
jgi:glycosyltransferase involved in cell wall biosynthesis